MAAKRKATAGRGTKQGDRFRVVLHAANHASVAELLRKGPFDVGPMRQRDKDLEVTLFAGREQIERLKREGWKLEVHENLSEIGRRRQKEVGKGDRFQGGKIPPKGLGKKIREGR